MSTVRAMTLVEVLAATVLLAVMVVACLPWLQASESVAREDENVGLSERELGRIADEILAAPDRFGFSVPDQAGALQDVQIELAGNTGMISVEVHVCWADQSDADHGWVQFRDGETRVFRWIKKPVVEGPGR